ncbi:hypothetical protein L596_026734 [Steinernema carpocapsae]|uniref:Uncharacterized protein n=1 Tax=Steinernema carpocapsae TaxID=34508 RepID=A0A4U5M2A1_STECR|nr:hypothetical protein L596_026734 [Steinernema carpocapsae]
MGRDVTAHKVLREFAYRATFNREQVVRKDKKRKPQKPTFTCLPQIFTLSTLQKKRKACFPPTIECPQGERSPNASKRARRRRTVLQFCRVGAQRNGLNFVGRS